MTTTSPAPSSRVARSARYAIALLLVVLALAAATAVPVATGDAAVITRFGRPHAVQIDPGLSWKLPPPIDRVERVDLRLLTTASGMHSVLTSDGLSILIQTWVAWRVGNNEEDILRYLRATNNRPMEAANHLRTFLGSALETVTGRFAMDDLITTIPGQLRLDAYRAAVQERLAVEVRSLYGIHIVDIGIERLSVPEVTLDTTIARMSAERQTVAEEKKSGGRRLAGEIRAQADKSARILKADAEEEAARIEASARTEAARIYADVHSRDPQLYRFLRSLDALERSVTASTRLVLRTDTAPFNALVLPPPGVPLEPLLPAPTTATATAPGLSQPTP